ncbi:hypothetical protein OAL00_06835 [Verrucomicrobiales bacterium]|nr:hypothetical protein [Verrucomicrobiales bacterium]
MKTQHHMGIALTLIASVFVSCVHAASPDIEVERFKTNPLITGGTPGVGSNVCGPSVIRVPEWVEKPLGRYYMYFARHMSSSIGDAYIRLAYSDAPEGPWTVYRPGTLKRTQLRDIERKADGLWYYTQGKIGKPAAQKQHIASPDVHVDNENQQIIMYFHGRYKGHNSGAAISSDGIHFEDKDVDLGPPYLRMFTHEGQYYGISQKGGDGAALLRRFDGPFGPVGESIPIIPRTIDGETRHLAVLTHKEQLIIFYSRTGSKPERIQASVLKLSSDWKDWKASEPIEIIAPDHPFEGSELPLEKSRAGTGRNVRELRDPCVFVDQGGQIYLYYSIKGESGIAGAKLSISD